MNVYSDNEFTAIRLLAARTDTLPQFHYMGGDFNCHSSAWDPVPHSANVAASHWLLEAAATIGPELGTVSNPGPTDIPRDASKHPSVIDLVFLLVALSASVSTERVIQSMLDSDHILLLTHVPVSPAVRTAMRRCLPSDPEKVQDFLDDLVAKLRLIVPDDVAETPDDVEAAASAVASAFSDAWLAHSRDSNVTRRSNHWWNEACATALQQHRASRDPADWAHFRRTVKEAKCMFFNAQIAEIAVKSKRRWNLMNWVQQHKLPLCKAIQYQGQPCHEMSALWDALHGTYNAASGRVCDMTVLDPLPNAPTRGWAPFSLQELNDSLSSCSNRSAPGPDHIGWSHLKLLVKDTHCVRVLLLLANASLRVGHWPATFKESLSVIIPKPGKPSYSAPNKIHVPEEMAALAAMPVPKSAHIKPVGSKMLACAQQRLYLDAFLQELEGDADTIHAAADGSLPTSERLQATAAVIIRRQTEQLHQNRFVAGIVTAHDTEPYAIRSAVVQCTQHDAKQIVIFTDAIGSARDAADPSPHSGQAYSLAVCAALQDWLQGDEERTITFVDVPSALRWSLHGQAHQLATQLRVPLRRNPALTINSIRQTTDLWREQEWKTKFLHSPLPSAAFL
ncbi:hypothetical protein D9619_011854 [Psilocybe cf. subviscida]|uniref:Endonuclease/exonuclease/phosphatase domain-containing protein n=1 Tax=Psilocybe cf. subviscida TaxID=2480587 RepID=A0A8H5B2D4_9AGAR|nr:hypothetical protein D9619_011854 [Psilocybe cf. subviscida]